MSMRCRRVIIAIAIAIAMGLCAFAAGWLSSSSSAMRGSGAGARTAGGARTEIPVQETQALSRGLLRAEARPTLDGSGSSRPVLYPNMKLNEEEKALLELTPEEAVAKGDAGGASVQHILRCMELLPEEPPALCQRIDKSMHDLRLANIKLMREFLSGTLEAVQFQEQYHRNMLSFQVALEGYLSFEEMMQYVTVQPGDDPFMVMAGWGFALPPGYIIGEDILSRQDGEGGPSALAPGGDARSPWSWGKQHWPETNQ
jgi:hypothetical protein